uniref:Putative secreted protein n=1 Tax=Ixodes ricinus TaxID=34613 RepID=A0A6B0TZN0_IXORI
MRCFLRLSAIFCCRRLPIALSFLSWGQSPLPLHCNHYGAYVTTYDNDYAPRRREGMLAPKQTKQKFLLLLEIRFP